MDWIDLRCTDDIERDLVVRASEAVGCSHPDRLSIAHLHQWKRVLRITCPACPRTVVLKSFGRDVSAQPDEQRRRFDIERGNIQKLAELGFCSGTARIPSVCGFVESPHFCIVEEYCGGTDLLDTIRSAISQKNPDPLYHALTQLSIFLARLHEASHRVLSVPTGNLPSLSNAAELLQAVKGQCLNSQYERLHELLTVWKLQITPDLHPDSLVHDGLTPVNILYSKERDDLVVVDLETLHPDTPFADIGTVAAELKFNFALHSGNPFEAEPFIAYFLREYFSMRTTLQMSFPLFTYYQTFFMGRRFLSIATGRWLDDSLRQWAVTSALEVWSAVHKRDDIRRPIFRDATAVLFDFYNTLVSVRDDERELSNFAAVRNLLAKHLRRPIEDLPSETWLRDTYFAAIERACVESREAFPDVDLVVIWSSVLGRSGSGVPIEKLFKDGRRLVNRVMEVFRHSAIRMFEPFQGVADVLKQLKKAGLKVGIISDAQPAYVINEIDRAGLFGVLDCLVLSADYRYRKPDKRLFLDATAKLQSDPSRSVFIGDDFYRDIYGAQQAGMRTVYKRCPYTARYYGNLSPDAVIQRHEELLDLFGLSGRDTQLTWEDSVGPSSASRRMT